MSKKDPKKVVGGSSVVDDMPRTAMASVSGAVDAIANFVTGAKGDLPSEDGQFQFLRGSAAANTMEGVGVSLAAASRRSEDKMLAAKDEISDDDLIRIGKGGVIGKEGMRKAVVENVLDPRWRVIQPQAANLFSGKEAGKEGGKGGREG